MGKDVGFSLKLEPELRAAFIAAADSAHRPAAQIVRELMRGFVERQKRRAFEEEARRQSRAVAERSRDPDSEEAQVQRELDALFDEDPFDDEWKA